MARTKEPKPIAELHADIVDNYSLEDRVKLHEALTKNIKAEATRIKENGIAAEQILKKIDAGQ